MIEAEIDPRDLIEFNLDMDRLQMEELLEGELAPFAKAVGMSTGKYPPEVSGSTYVRTENLSRNWYTKLLDKRSVEVGNLAFYAGYVHGREQVPWHGEHGWRELHEIGESSIVSFMRRIAEKAARIWSS